MGAKDSKTKSLQYDPKGWEELEKSTLYEVIKNKNSGVYGHLYHFNIKSDKQLKDQIQIYNKRRAPGNYVQILGANVEKSGFGFCGTQQNANVVTQRIPVFLNGTSNLNQEQSNIVLYNAIKGFQESARMVIPGQITDKMIGFNQSGNTKVWVNQNFGMNHPMHQAPKSNINERQIIGRVVSLVSAKGQLSGDYTNALGNSGTFSNALSFIQQNSRLPGNVLQANRINSGRFQARQQISSLVSNQIPKPVTANTNINVISNPVVETTNTKYNYTSYGLPPVINTNSGYRAPTINMQYGGKTQTLHRVQPGYTSGYASDINRTSSNLYQIPSRYVETIEQPKYSFQSGNLNSQNSKLN